VSVSVSAVPSKKLMTDTPIRPDVFPNRLQMSMIRRRMSVGFFGHSQL
jgi:hypothetical protein